MDQYINFYYRAQTDGILRFTLTIQNIDGDADMFASYEQNPNELNAMWRTPWWGAKIILIRDSFATYYYLSVKGTQKTTFFNLKASSDLEIIYPGQMPIIDFVERRGEMRNYQTYVSSRAKYFWIGTTLISGSTTLYINNNDTIPTENNYLYKFQEWPGHQFFIDNESPDWRGGGTWSFSIYGNEGSDYYVTSQSDLNPQVLDYGHPASGSVTTTIMQFYRIYINTSKRLHLSLKTYDWGCVIIYASQTQERPDENNFKWRAESDPYLSFQIIASIASSEFDKDKDQIYIGVQACYFDGFPHKFDLSVAAHDEPFYLNQETPTYQKRSDIDNSLKPPNYILQSYMTARGVTVTVESCTSSRVLGNLYGTTNTSSNFPIRQPDPDLIGVNYGRYTQGIYYQGNKFQDKQLLISYLPVGGDVTTFSIFASTRGSDPRPFCTSITRTFIRHLDEDLENPARDVHSIDIKPVQSNSYPLVYELYAIDKEAEGSENYNFETVCGIRNVEIPRLIAVWEAFEPKGYSIQAEFPHGSSYLVNVIISDSRNRQATCGVPAGIFYFYFRNSSR
jgi:hypothetical protein